jgi:hypothetical protein
MDFAVFDVEQVNDLVRWREKKRGKRTFDVARVAKLVHDDSNLPTVLLLKDVVEQRALSAAEIASHDCHGHLSASLSEGSQLRSPGMREVREVDALSFIYECRAAVRRREGSASLERSEGDEDERLKFLVLN